MVSVSYTVVDVRTMMVESLHTLIAYVAVSAPRRPDRLAIGAQVERLHLIEQLLKVDVRTSLHVARVHKRSETEHQDQHCCQCE